MKLFCYSINKYAQSLLLLTGQDMQANLYPHTIVTFATLLW